MNVLAGAFLKVHRSRKNVESKRTRFVHLITRQTERHFHHFAILSLDFENFNSADGKNFDALRAESLIESLFGVVVAFKVAADDINSVGGNVSHFNRLLPKVVSERAALIIAKNFTAGNRENFSRAVKTFKRRIVNRQGSYARRFSLSQHVIKFKSFAVGKVDEILIVNRQIDLHIVALDEVALSGNDNRGEKSEAYDNQKRPVVVKFFHADSQLLIARRLDESFTVSHFDCAEFQIKRHFNGLCQVEVVQKFVEVDAAQNGVFNVYVVDV